MTTQPVMILRRAQEVQQPPPDGWFQAHIPGQACRHLAAILPGMWQTIGQGILVYRLTNLIQDPVYCVQCQTCCGYSSSDGEPQCEPNKFHCLKRFAVMKSRQSTRQARSEFGGIQTSLEHEYPAVPDSSLTRSCFIAAACRLPVKCLNN